MAHEHALLSLSQAKTYLEIDHEGDDEMLDDLLAEAEGALVGFIRRRVSQKSVTEIFDGGGDILFLKNFPVSAITTVTDLNDDTIVDAAFYRTNLQTGQLWRTDSLGRQHRGVGHRHCGWYDGVQRWSVVYLGGLDQHPDWDHIQPELRGTIRDLVADAYENRNPSAERIKEGPTETWMTSGIIPDRVLRVWRRYREII